MTNLVSSCVQQSLFSWGFSRPERSTDSSHVCCIYFHCSWIGRLFAMSPFEPWTTKDKVERVSLGIANFSPARVLQRGRSQIIWLAGLDCCRASVCVVVLLAEASPSVLFLAHIHSFSYCFTVLVYSPCEIILVSIQSCIIVPLSLQKTRLSFPGPCGHFAICCVPLQLFWVLLF